MLEALIMYVLIGFAVAVSLLFIFVLLSGRRVYSSAIRSHKKSYRKNLSKQKITQQLIKPVYLPAKIAHQLGIKSL